MLPLLSSYVEGTMLYEWPMLAAHDAGTGYLDSSWYDSAIINWAKTQTVGLDGQLDCGARALDLRTMVDDGKLVMYHGDITTETTAATAVGDVVSWVASNVDELVILYLMYDDDDAKTETVTLFSSLSIAYIDDCDELVGLTVDGALKKSKLPGGVMFSR